MGQFVHRPQTEAEIAQILSAAAARGATQEVVGGGTHTIGNRVEAKERLSTAALAGVTLYEPASLTLVARAGTPLAEIEKLLAREGQHLPFEPVEWSAMLRASAARTSGEATIGGTVAAGVSGPRRIRAGALRDSLIGVRFVTGGGEIVKNGGRVMKNVTGYDLVKLMAGSHGALGVLTEVAFKLLPKPETAAQVTLRGLDDESAVRAMAAALGTPFEVSGAAHAPGGFGRKPATFLRIEGLAESVAYRAGRLREVLGAFGAAAIEKDAKVVKETWKRIGEAETFDGEEGSLWRLSLKPSDAPALVAALDREYHVKTLYDWAGGLVWLLLREPAGIGATAIRALVDRAGGHATLMRAAGGAAVTFPAFHPEKPAVAAISAELRRCFDPFGILNPGRMAQAVAPRG
jgi:glycolate oxidase FAD binding subunit